ncbi:MAG TPA: hypothetical protein VGM39_12680 [Kofleriaceae bacterium]|jgi:hypothetical protein
MSNKPEDTFASIDPAQLATVSGGTGSSSNDQLTAMISSISDSIKGLIANQSNNSGGGDTMQMMMMMMMGGMGGGGGQAVQYAAPAPQQQPVINVDTSLAGHCGKKGC